MSLLYSVAVCTQISILSDWVELFLELLVILYSLLICFGGSPLRFHLATTHCNHILIELTALVLF
jgi:hypothetical protein